MACQPSLSLSSGLASDFYAERQSHLSLAHTHLLIHGGAWWIFHESHLLEITTLIFPVVVVVVVGAYESKWKLEPDRHTHIRFLCGLSVGGGKKKKWENYGLSPVSAKFQVASKSLSLISHTPKVDVKGLGRRKNGWAATLKNMIHLLVTESGRECKLQQSKWLCKSDFGEIWPKNFTKISEQFQ